MNTTTAPIPIPGRATTTSWRTSSTCYTSDNYFFDDVSSTSTSPTITRTTTVTTEKDVKSLASLSSSTTYRRYVDSGYGTGNVSLEDKDSDRNNSKGLSFQAHQEEKEIKIKSTPLPGKEDLHVFRKDIDASYTARYREIMPELHRLLQRQLILCSSSTSQPLVTGRRLFQSATRASARSRVCNAPAVQMSLRLMTVGTNVQDAKPTIVVFTLGGHQTSGLEKFLKQPPFHQLCKPDDGITPSFEVIVVGEPARKRRYLGDVSALFDDASARDSSTVTYCGARIRLEAAVGGGGTMGAQSAIATLGGVVKLTFEVGDFMLVGMTAGHVLEDLYSLDDSESENGENQDENPSFSSQPKRRALGGILYPPVSTVQDEDEDLLPEIPPRDWALFELANSLKLKPNLIPRDTDPGQYQRLFHRGSQSQSQSHSGRPRRPQEHCMSTAAPPKNFLA